MVCVVRDSIDPHLMDRLLAQDCILQTHKIIPLNSPVQESCACLRACFWHRLHESRSSLTLHFHSVAYRSAYERNVFNIREDLQDVFRNQNAAQQRSQGTGKTKKLGCSCHSYRRYTCWEAAVYYSWLCCEVLVGASLGDFSMLLNSFFKRWRGFTVF